MGKLAGIVALLTAVEAILVPLIAFLFQAPLLTHPFWLARHRAGGHRSDLRRWARCSRRCWCARGAATCCCRCCCIRSPFQSSLREFAERRRCCSRELDMDLVGFWLLLLVCFDVVFVTLALWTFEPLMTD